jgi:hypothetical protein
MLTRARAIAHQPRTAILLACSVAPWVVGLAWTKVQHLLDEIGYNPTP